MRAIEMLSEPVNVPDTYVSGLSHVEDMGDGMYRLTFYATRESIYGGMEHTIEVRLVATLPAILAGMKTCMTAVGYRCCGAEDLRALSH
ncbi:hypothetical protein [Chelativorans xinjiangense]|uniref:hypothetical protein n=1 Tax=Chelativorans xinjiangense TaxID=2681485 RepID=UPI00135CE2D0|nr:hypothetical protein [Chelativorans xinjiangense]